MAKITRTILHTFTGRYEKKPYARVVEVQREYFAPFLVIEYAHHVDAMGDPAWHPVEWHKPLPQAIQGLAEKGILSLAKQAAEEKNQFRPQVEPESVKPA